MGKSAVLAIKIIGDATSSVAAMSKAQRAAETFKDKLNRAASVAKVGFAAISAGAVVCAKAAGDLQQSVGGVETVFGNSAKKMLDWSGKAAQAAGLSQNSYNEMATIIGSQLQNMGMAQDQSADKTNQLIGLGADLSSMFGGTTTDAVDALSSALKGEMDPIEKYGISLNDATLKAQAQKMGLGQLYAAGDKNAKMQATLAAITAQSGKAQGNFGKEADTAQGQQARMSAELDNAKAKLGMGLLPALTAGAKMLAGFGDWVQKNTSWLGPLVVIIGGIAAAIIVLNTAWGIYSAVQAVVSATTLTTAGAFGVLAGATGIGLLIAIVALVIMNWNKIVPFFQGIWNAIVGVFSAVGTWFSQQFQTAVAGIQIAWAAVTGFFSGIWNGIVGVFSIVGTWFSQQFQMAWLGIQIIWGAVTGFFSGIWNGIVAIFSIVGGWFSQQFQMAWLGIQIIWNGVTGFFSGIWNGIVGIFSAVGGWFRGIFQSAWNGVSSVWNGAVSTFQNIKNGIVNVFSKVGDAISAPFKAAFNGIKGLWNSTVGKIGFTVPDWIPGIGGKSFHVPQLASGGVLRTAGTVMVGEVGPELLTLPAGAQVTPLSRASYHFGDSGQAKTVTYNITINGAVDKRGTALELKKLLTDLEKQTA